MRRERVFDLLLNSCVRARVSNEERVFDLLLNSCIRSQFIYEERESV